jgi:hypothetical protein
MQKSEYLGNSFMKELRKIDERPWRQPINLQQNPNPNEDNDLQVFELAPRICFTKDSHISLTVRYDV